MRSRGLELGALAPFRRELPQFRAARPNELRGWASSITSLRCATSTQRVRLEIAGAGCGQSPPRAYAPLLEDPRQASPHRRARYGRFWDAVRAPDWSRAM